MRMRDGVNGDEGGAVQYSHALVTPPGGGKVSAQDEDKGWSEVAAAHMRPAHATGRESGTV